ncbi:MAG: cyclic nucleotide-binding domain-containing protein [Nocardioides sp.]
MGEDAARNPDLRRAQLSFLGAWTAEWAFTVALGIVAYREGEGRPSASSGCCQGQVAVAGDRAQTAVGVGAVAGSLAASLLVGTRRRGAWFAVGVTLWGLPLALVGLLPHDLPALVFMALIGVGNALIDVAGFTLLGRMAPDAVLARVFGVLESLVAVSIGVGALAASWIVGEWGLRPALVAVGLLCPLLAAASWWRLRALDGTVGLHDEVVGLLQRVPMLRTLPLPSVEQLARGLEVVDVPAGTTVFERGDLGDRYYVVESGAVDVVGEGRVIASLGPGEGFGEIALLRRSARTATVVATADSRLRTLASEHFLAVVLGYTPSAREASLEVDQLLDRYDPDRSDS